MIALAADRRTSPTTLIVLLLLLALSFSPRSHSDATNTGLVSAVDSIGITVKNMDRAVEFYTQVLGFERVDDREVTGENYERLYGVFGLRLHTTHMQLGDESIELMEFLAPRGRPEPADSRSNDRWFQHVAIIVSDIDRAYRRLREHHVEHASTGPQVLPDWNPGAAGIAAFYFRDPDGNHLEILHFPVDKGAARWHTKPGHVRTDKLFLGIDHTAIVVADTEASLRYYRDTLGLKVAGTSENYGTEQEHLNNVFGARLRITALRAATGPGVELLEYLAPRTGRPMPVDTLASDDWHWQINFRSDVAAADQAARRGHYAYVSPGPVLDGNSPALLIRDPDGHAAMLR